MDVLVLIDKLDDVVHNARPVPLTDQVRVDREEIYDLLDQMRATIPEEIKQARWIVKERQEMLAEAKREAERIVREAREQQARLISDEEVTKQAERAADEIVEDARAREREIRLGAEDYADEILNTLEVNLQKFLAAVQRGRDRRSDRGSCRRGEAASAALRAASGRASNAVRVLETRPQQPPGSASPPHPDATRGEAPWLEARACSVVAYSSFSSSSFDQRGSGVVLCSCKAGSASLSDSPQTGQRPAQSGQQRTRVGVASTAASCAQRPMSSSSSAT
jgi:cell division septum initiation protein DivIVA